MVYVPNLVHVHSVIYCLQLADKTDKNGDQESTEPKGNLVFSSLKFSDTFWFLTSCECFITSKMKWCNSMISLSCTKYKHHRPTLPAASLTRQRAGVHLICCRPILYSTNKLFVAQQHVRPHKSLLTCFYAAISWNAHAYIHIRAHVRWCTYICDSNVKNDNCTTQTLGEHFCFVIEQIRVVMCISSVTLVAFDILARSQIFLHVSVWNWKKNILLDLDYRWESTRIYRSVLEILIFFSAKCWFL